MIRAILVDDEIAALRSLGLLLEKYCPEVEVLGTARSAKEGLDMVIKFNPDLVFLDIEMPAGSGFELIEQSPELDFQVIFVTAYNKYAVKAFKYSAVDYLLKPVEIDELETAVKRVLEQKRLKINPRERYSILFENIREVLPRKFVFPEGHGYSYIDLNEVLFVNKKTGKYSFFLLNGTTKDCPNVNINIEEILIERGFHPISSTCMVNLNTVQKVDKAGKGKVILENGYSLPLDEVKKEDFIDKLLWFSQNKKK
jgi:two-component system LytT family response regulator